MEGSLVSVTGLESWWTLRHLVCPAVPIPAPQMGSCSTHSHLCCCAQNSSSTCSIYGGDLLEIWGLLVIRTSDAHCLSSHFVLCRYCFYLALQLWVVWLHLLVFLSPRIMWSPNFVWVFGLGVAGFALLISLFLLLSLLMGRKRRQGILEDWKMGCLWWEDRHLPRIPTLHFFIVLADLEMFC